MKIFNSIGCIPDYLLNWHKSHNEVKPRITCKVTVINGRVGPHPEYCGSNEFILFMLFYRSTFRLSNVDLLGNFTTPIIKHLLSLLDGK